MLLRRNQYGDWGSFLGEQKILLENAVIIINIFGKGYLFQKIVFISQ